MKFAQAAKRIFLFVMVNVLVIFTIAIICQIFHVPQRLGTSRYGGLMVFCLVVGMGGSVISLLLSRQMAKWMQGVRVIDPNTTDSEEQFLVETVYRLARTAGLTDMPEVGVYNSPEMNAFATGPSRSRALVAVSSGLLGRMRSDDLEGVLAHELAHVANGDMVTMTLIQGIVNAIAMFLAWALAIALSQGSSRDDDERGGNYFLQWMLADVFRAVFMLLGMIVVMWFSRWREFRADAGGARYAGRGRMIGALRALEAAHDEGADLAGPQQPAFQALKISGKTGGFMALFASHPPLEERIRRLEAGV
ncbi:MAG TPA: protease HtpX [Verrucomicrobiae bacterium]|nr:protease HtpX [Verrucomicrobiae bacterium]